MSHATLRITRTDDAADDSYRFEVWDPVEGRYEPHPGLDEAAGRMQAIAAAVRELWVAHDPRLEALRAAPPAGTAEEFAEMRVTAQANRHYDVRSFDNPDWTLFPGYLEQALAHVCGEVGYVVERAVPPVETTRRQSGKS